MRIAFFTFLSLFLASSCTKQPETKTIREDQAALKSKVQTATTLMYSGQVDTGLAILDSLIEAGETDISIFTGLGLGHRMNKNYPEAVEAYRMGLKIEPGSGTTMFNLGLTYAQQDQKDNAFDWLLKAKKTGEVNMTSIGGNPAGKNLQDDARYQSLFPSEAEYADPFQENTQIIHEWTGEGLGHQFGWIARNIGDVDGDRINDFTTSAPTFPDNQKAQGKIYVYSGKSGEELWSFTGEDEGGQLGSGVESAGDVNADGIPDVVAGAPYANKVMVFSGFDGTLLSVIKGSDEKGCFGNDVKGIGDINGDGYGDLLIGEPYQIFNVPLNSQTVAHPGKAHLYSGKDFSLLHSWSGAETDDAFGSAVAGKVQGDQTFIVVGAPNAGPNGGGTVYVYPGLTADTAFTIRHDETGSRLGGMFLSVIGDVDNDQTLDIYATDWSNSAEGAFTGRAYVYSGTGSELWTFTGENSGDGFGIGVADAGDVDGDGHDDIIIGAWQQGSGSPGGGKIYVYSGKTGEIISTITGKVMGETFGFDTTGIGDVNGDGKIDYLITSAWSSINGFQSGRVYIIAG